MRRIVPATPPYIYARVRQLRATYSELSSDPAVRRALWKEQGHRCAYCERRLRNPERSDHGTKIEHFHPQSSSLWTSDCQRNVGASNSDLASVSWGNLLLCCDGGEGSGRNFTCDTAKASQEICASFRNPKNASVEFLVDIDNSGRASSVAGLPQGSYEVVETVLNLNADHLVAARRRVILELKKRESGRRKNGNLSSNDRDILIERLREAARESDFGATYLSYAARLSKK